MHYSILRQIRDRPAKIIYIIESSYLAYVKEMNAIGEDKGIY
jgi:hypothetical protein